MLGLLGAALAGAGQVAALHSVREGVGFSFFYCGGSCSCYFLFLFFFFFSFLGFSGSSLIIICSFETINQRQTRQSRYVLGSHVGNWDTTASKTGVSIRNMCALRYRWTFRELLSTSL